MSTETNTAGPGEVSPGRAAYEAYAAAMPHLYCSTWDEITDELRGAMEDAATAAIDADPRWPRCPDGCGCRLGTGDADRSDCACDGPCTAECRENGYPDAPSYRDLAVKHAMDELDAARAAYRRVCEERDRLREAEGSLYRERAHLTAFLAACYPSVQCPDFDDDEYVLLYVTTPDGQMSWHVHVDDSSDLLGSVPMDEAAKWDGHSTEEKYRRLEALVRSVTHMGPPAQVDASIAERERDKLRSLIAEILGMAEGTLNGETHIRRGEIARWRERAGIAS